MDNIREMMEILRDTVHRVLIFLVEHLERPASSGGQAGAVAQGAITSATCFSLRDKFLTPSEVRLYRWLLDAADGKAAIFPKVRVTDILKVIDAPHHMDEAVSIDRRSVSFLVCDLKTMKPLIAVDAEGSRSRSTSFPAVSRAFRGAGLPVASLSETSLDDELSCRKLVQRRIDEVLVTCKARQPAVCSNAGAKASPRMTVDPVSALEQLQKASIKDAPRKAQKEDGSKPRTEAFGKHVNGDKDQSAQQDTVRALSYTLDRSRNCPSGLRYRRHPAAA